MAEIETLDAPAEVAAEPMVRPDRRRRQRNKPRRLPPYAVVLHNDNVNRADYVVGALRKVFNYGRLRAFRLMLQAHVTGRSVVWAGSLEVAELKADQLRSCGPDPSMKQRGALPLHVSIEPTAD